ncbi:MAG: hypothetical protein Q9190_003885 [Brigantiaea leucoxantha]
MNSILHIKVAPKEHAGVNLLSDVFASIIIDFTTSAGVDVASIDILSVHSQPFWPLSIQKYGRIKTSLPMAPEASILTARTNITTVTDIHIPDRATAGHQSPPPTTFFDALLLRHPTKFRICQNISGLATACFIPPDTHGGIDEYYDMDTGLGNLFTEAVIQTLFKDESRQADSIFSNGRIDEEIAHSFRTENQSFFSSLLLPDPIAPPTKTSHKSLADDLVVKALEKGLSPSDILRTAARITSQTMADCYEFFAPSYGIDEIFLYGDGSYGALQTLDVQEVMRREYPSAKVRMLDDFGIPDGAKETIASAWLGVEGMIGRAVVMPKRGGGGKRMEGEVGEEESVVREKVVPGRNWRDLMRRARGFGGDAVSLPAVREMVLWRDGEVVDRKL